MTTWQGSYTILELDEDGLTIKPTDQAIAEQADLLTKPFHQVQAELLEDHLANGWELVAPEDIGALTAATILTNDCDRDSNGVITRIGAVYSDIDFYQLRLWYEEMFDRGSVAFKRYT